MRKTFLPISTIMIFRNKLNIFEIETFAYVEAHKLDQVSMDKNSLLPSNKARFLSER